MPRFGRKHLACQDDTEHMLSCAFWHIDKTVGGNVPPECQCSILGHHAPIRRVEASQDLAMAKSFSLPESDTCLALHLRISPIVPDRKG
jgi:hypothetical protein